jgi:DNA-binding XRE family transcriptional regulator
MVARKKPVKSLASILGISDDDPELLAAREDTRGVDRLFDTLVTHRQARKISQADVAKRMGTTQSAVSDLERSGSNPKLFTLLKYARAIDMRIHLMSRPVDESCWHSTTHVAPSHVTATTSQPPADWPAALAAKSA